LLYGSVPQYRCPAGYPVPTCYFFIHDPAMPVCAGSETALLNCVIPQPVTYTDGTTTLYFAYCGDPVENGVGYCQDWFVGGGGVWHQPNCGDVYGGECGT
jgi:hypothetical protein